MTKTTSTKTQPKKSVTKKSPEARVAQPNNDAGTKQPLYRLRSLMPALLIIGAIVAIAAMTQSSRGLDTHPETKITPSAAVKTESVLAHADTSQNQPENSSSDIPSEPVNAPVSITPANPAAAAHPAPQTQTVQPPAPASPTLQPTPATSNPVPPNSPPVISPPAAETPHKPNPHADKGLVQIVDRLLSTLLP